MVVDGEDGTWALASAHAERDSRVRASAGRSGGERRPQRRAAIQPRGVARVPRRRRPLRAARAREPARRGRRRRRRSCTAAGCGCSPTGASWRPSTRRRATCSRVLARHPAFAIDACLVRRALVERVGRLRRAAARLHGLGPLAAHRSRRRRLRRRAPRWSPATSSIPTRARSNPEVLLADGLRVIDRAHMPDARVPGAPTCAWPRARRGSGAPGPGWLRGHGLRVCDRRAARTPGRLLRAAGRHEDPELDADVVAGALRRTRCHSARAWRRRTGPSCGRATAPRVESFLDELERRVDGPGLRRALRGRARAHGGRGGRASPARRRSGGRTASASTSSARCPT